MASGERWKERVELSLDGRQIFFLFFGSAVLACLLFVAGVLVGRHIEQRAAVPLAGEDPLATLDQLDSAEADDGLTFHEALTRPDRKGSRGGARAGRSDDPHAAARRAEGSAARPLPQAGKPAAGAAKPEDSASATDEGARRPDAATRTGHYTLQLNSFLLRDEADQFAARLRQDGVNAQVVQSEVPGKGTFFRVRAGDYASRQTANEARQQYEKSRGGTALVSPM